MAEANEPSRKYLIAASFDCGRSTVIPTRMYEHSVVSSKPKYSVTRSEALAANIMPVEANSSRAWYSAGRTCSAPIRRSESSAASASAQAISTLKNWE